MTRTILTLLFALTAGAAQAHDFWLQPERFWTPAGAATPLTLQVGHGDQRQRSRLPLSRVLTFGVVGPGGVATDLRPTLQLGGDTEDGRLTLPAPGAYVLALATDDNAQSHLPADRFNAYLAEEGLTSAQRHRTRTHREAAEGSERYSRVAKALVQVGASAAAADPATRPLGLRLEIVPEASPYAGAATLPVRVYYEGRPLAGALVKLTDLAHDAEPVESQRTDAAGRARFTAPRQGTWLLNVVWTKPLPPGAETDFATIFSSLSFGFPPGQP